MRLSLATSAAEEGACSDRGRPLGTLPARDYAPFNFIYRIRAATGLVSTARGG
jgi:hypothetical protein